MYSCAKIEYNTEVEDTVQNFLTRSAYISSESTDTTFILACCSDIFFRREGKLIDLFQFWFYKLEPPKVDDLRKSCTTPYLHTKLVSDLQYFPPLDWFFIQEAMKLLKTDRTTVYWYQWPLEGKLESPKNILIGFLHTVRLSISYSDRFVSMSKFFQIEYIKFMYAMLWIRCFMRGEEIYWCNTKTTQLRSIKRERETTTDRTIYLSTHPPPEIRKESLYLT